MKILTKVVMLLALLFSTDILAQIPLLKPIDGEPIDDCLRCKTPSVSLSGSTSASLNTTKTYTVNVSSGIHSASSYLVSGGKITSQSKTAVSVKWTSTGSRWVKVNATVSGNTYSATRSVSVTAPLSGGTISASTTTSICNGTDPGTINNSQSASGGNGSFSYQWQVLSDGPKLLEPSLDGSTTTTTTTWRNILEAKSSSYNPPKLYADATYRRKVTSGSQTSYSNSITYQVAESLNKGSISYSGGAINPGTKPTVISGTTATGGDGISYRWQWKRGTESSFSNIPTGLGSSVTSRSYQPQTLNKTTVFRRRVSSCGQTQYTNQVTIKVNLNPGSISGNQTLCVGSDASNISSASLASGGNGSYTYKWERREYRPTLLSPDEPLSLDGTSKETVEPSNTSYSWTGWVEIASGTSYNPGVISYKTQYRRKVSSAGVTKYSNTVTKDVFDNVDPGNISYTGGSINAGSTPTRIDGTTASGGSSISYQWYKKTNGGYSEIVGATNQNYQPGTLNRTTTFQRVASSNCGNSASSNEVKIVVNLNPGSIESDDEIICSGFDPGVINSTAAATGGTGNYQYQWQSFSELQSKELILQDDSEPLQSGSILESSWRDLAGQTNETFNPPALSVDMIYRRKVTSGGQEAYTTPKRYTVSDPLSAGSISYSGGAVSADGDPPAITGTAATGGIAPDYQWQKKMGTASGYSNITGAKSEDYNPPAGIDYTTTYRRRVKSCGETKYSNSVTIDVNFFAGSISGTQRICQGDDPSMLTSSSVALGGHGDYDYQWQKSEFRPLDLVLIEEPLTLDDGTEPTSTKSLEGVKYVWYEWEDIDGEKNANYDPPTQSYVTKYRRKVVSNGVTIYSNVVTVDFHELPEPGTITYSGGDVMPGTTASMLSGTALTSNSDFNYEWFKKVNGGTYEAIPNSNTKDLSPGVLNYSTFFIRQINNGCGQVDRTLPLKIKVNLTPGTVTENQYSVCNDCDRPTLTVGEPSGGNGNYSYQWQVLGPELISEDGSQDLVLEDPLLKEGETSLQSDTDNSNLMSYKDIKGAIDATYTPIQIGKSTMSYRRVVKSDGQTVNSTPISVTILPAIDPGTISYNYLDPCEGNDVGLITGTAPTGGDGSYEFQWQYFDGSNWITFDDSNSQSFDPTFALTSNTLFRRRTRSAGSSWKKSNELIISVYQVITNAGVGTLSAADKTYCPGARVTFSYNPGAGVNTNKTRLIGLKDGKEHDFGIIKNTLTIPVQKDVSYYVKYDQRCTPIDYQTNSVSFNFYENCNLPPSLDQNFVRTEVPKIPVSDEYELSVLDASQKAMSYSYSDGLGRPTMKVAVEAGQDFEDVIQFSKYNAQGRQEFTYIPYYKDAMVPGKFIETNDAVTEQSEFYDTTHSDYSDIAHDSKPYSKTEWDARGRVKAVIAPGKAWHDGNKKTTYTYAVYDPAKAVDKPWSIHTEVTKWTISGGLPKQDGSYKAKELSITMVTDVEGRKSRKVTDGRGLTITSQIYDKDQKKWIGSYNVYDDFGRVRFVIPPLLAKISTPTQDQVNELAFQYKYDKKGRVIRERAPGAGWVEYVYDYWNRIVLQRHAAQVRNCDSNGENCDNYWTFYKYDALNRQVMSGEILDNRTREQLQTEVLLLTDQTARYEERTNSSLGYTNDSAFPSSIGYSDMEIYTVNYFDDHHFIDYPNWDAEGNDYSFTNPTGFANTLGTSLVGRSTGSKVKILDTDIWLNTVVYYDDRGRVIQTISENHKGGTDRLTNDLDWKRELQKMLVEHTGTTDDVSILSEYAYAHNGQLLKTWQTLDGGDRILVGDYHYNVLGELVEKNLHALHLAGQPEPVEGFLQSVDYRYNLQGAMTRINDADLGDGENDLFGMEYFYETSATINGSATTGRYDGMVNAMIWNATNITPTSVPFGGPQGGTKTGIAFTYDNQSRLKSTQYATGPSLSDQLDAYSMSVGNYDDNGNIQSLSRNAGGDEVDNLTYRYNENSNKLKSVDDVSTAANSSLGLNDPMMARDVVTEYTYDAMGNMIEDVNKKIQRISYNHLQLVESIEFTDGTMVDYTYDAARNRLAKEVLDADGNSIARVDYVGLVEYLDDEINQVFTDEGRAYKQNGEYHYEYFITDHQGNNRVAFGDLPERNVYTATMELNREAYEESHFKFPNDDIRSAAENHSPLGSGSIALNGAVANRQVGPAKVLTIAPGDEVDIEVWSKYNTAFTDNTPIDGIANAILNAFNLSGAGTGLEGQGGSLSNALSLGSNNIFSNASADEPRAYLQYLFFDENYNFVEAGSNFHEVTQQSLGKFAKYESGTLTYAQAGYLFVYLVNETNVDQDVFFDDLKITHSSATSSFKVSQVNDFYPFGLPTSNSWRAPGYFDPGLLYQSSYASYDSLTGYYDFLSRSYDPVLGRFFAVDPAGQFSSPYTGMGNMPHMGVDPNGEIFGLPFLPALFKSLMIAMSYAPTVTVTATAATSVSAAAIAATATVAAAGTYAAAGGFGTASGPNIGSGTWAIEHGHLNNPLIQGDPSIYNQYQMPEVSNLQPQGASQPQFAETSLPREPLPGKYEPNFMERADNWIMRGGGRRAIMEFFGSYFPPTTFISGAKSLTTGTNLYDKKVSGLETGLNLASAIPGGALLKGGKVVKNSVRAFHSGKGTAQRAAAEGFQTLGQTRAGKNLYNLTKGMEYKPGSEAYNMWSRLSRVYARGIPDGSTVHVFLNSPNPNSIWNTVEKPLLKKKGVKIIEH